MKQVEQMGIVKERVQTTASKKKWINPQILTIGNRALAAHIKAAALSGLCRGYSR